MPQQRTVTLTDDERTTLETFAHRFGQGHVKVSWKVAQRADEELIRAGHRTNAFAMGRW